MKGQETRGFQSEVKQVSSGNDKRKKSASKSSKQSFR